MISSLKPLKALDVFTPYDVFLMDIWGVLHNGYTLYPEAVDFLKTHGSKTILVSNSPSRSARCMEKLTIMGLDAHLIKGIYTSGEDAFQALLKYNDPLWVYHIGTPEQKHVFDTLPVTLVDDIKKASLMVITGFSRKTPDVRDYDPLFKEALLKNIPMFCVNPDKVVRLGEEIVYCSGYVADFFDRLGGKVTYYGKPYSDFYARMMHTHGLNEDSKKILVIGDSLTTDIQGAKNIGCDSLLLGCGIHSDVFFTQKDTEIFGRFFKDHAIFPTYYQPHLSLISPIFSF